MKSTLPSTIRICGIDYRVESLREDDIPESAGEWQSRRCLIRVRTSGTTADRIGQTFLHEVLHAIDHELALDIGEPRVQALAAGLYGALRQDACLALFGAEEAEGS